MGKPNFSDEFKRDAVAQTTGVGICGFRGHRAHYSELMARRIPR